MSLILTATPRDGSHGFYFENEAPGLLEVNCIIKNMPGSHSTDENWNPGPDTKPVSPTVSTRLGSPLQCIHRVRPKCPDRALRSQRQLTTWSLLLITRKFSRVKHNEKNSESEIGVQPADPKSKAASYWLLPQPQSEMASCLQVSQNETETESCLLLFYNPL